MLKTQWIALSYSVPTTPSKTRVFVWRRLRAIGAQALRPGLAVLPNEKDCLKSFEELAEKISELSGEATIIAMDFLSEKENAEMKKKFSQAHESCLRETLSECAELLDKLKDTKDSGAREHIERELKRRLLSFKKKSDSPIARQASEIEQAAGGLFEALKSLPSEFSALLHDKR